MRDSAVVEVGKTYIDGDKVDLGVTVLSGLGGGHVDDLAGTACGLFAAARSRSV